MTEGEKVSARSQRFYNGYGTAYNGIVVVAGARTPLGRVNGALARLNCTQMMRIAGLAALERAGIDRQTIDQVVFANAHPSSVDALFLPRHVALGLGLRQETPALLVQRICGSGIQVTSTAADEIVAGRARALLIGGADSTTRTPTVAFGGRMGYDFGQSPGFKDLFFEALTDSYIGQPLGITGENLAHQYQLSRHEVDQFAYESHTRAYRAVESGVFAQEIVSVRADKQVRLNTREKEFCKDETPRPDTSLEALAKLRPSFKEDGVQTAGNSCALADGAACLVVASCEEVSHQKLTALGRVVSVGVCGVDPNVMGIGPVPASKIALEMAGLKVPDIGRWEINEAFGAQVLACQKALGIERDKLNVNGGAIAFGHPLAATGVRLVLTLLYELARAGERYGVASACIGGGQGIAMVLEVV
ncbi:MAG: thiolase family protein [Candidatus Melainabacteria bacterium]|nr:thiolase family protein [Candidatus Melainabacteria bacterium]